VRAGEAARERLCRYRASGRVVRVLVERGGHRMEGRLLTVQRVQRVRILHALLLLHLLWVHRVRQGRQRRHDSHWRGHE
jgi:hypothetical protein